MGEWRFWGTRPMMILLTILVLALDIGGAGSILAIGAAKANGQHIKVLTGP
jgi:hypothetical protein